MPATTTYKPASPIAPKAILEQEENKPITWEEFEQIYLQREDDFCYEWVNGRVEKTPRTMNKTQAFIQGNLLDYFYRLKFEGKVSGQLLSELDLHFLENHRRPDMCWLTDEQSDHLAENAYEVPAFIIEIISSNDPINKVKEKMQDYRAAKVQMVWHIFPEFHDVHIYAGSKLKKMKVCMGKDLCSAASVIPGFAISAAAIFKKISKKAMER